MSALDAPMAAHAWHTNTAPALQAWGLPPGGELKLLSHSENATYRVSDPAGTGHCVLRLHQPGMRSLAHIASEVAWIGALRDTGLVHTPELVPTRTGERVACFTDGQGRAQHAVMFEYIAGGPPPAQSLERTFAELGRLSARLHQHARQWKRPQGFDRPAWGVEETMGRQGWWGHWRHNPQVGPREEAVLARVDAKIRQELATYDAQTARKGLIHGDMRQANLLQGEPGLYLIDFDDCGFSWELYELACSLSFIEDHPDGDALVAAWLGEYQKAHPLNADDLRAVAALVMLRRLLLVGWFGTHTHTQEAREIHTYVDGTLAIAERYLNHRFLRPAMAELHTGTFA